MDVLCGEVFSQIQSRGIEMEQVDISALLLQELFTPVFIGLKALIIFKTAFEPALMPSYRHYTSHYQASAQQAPQGERFFQEPGSEQYCKQH